MYVLQRTGHIRYGEETIRGGIIEGQVLYYILAARKSRIKHHVKFLKIVYEDTKNMMSFKS